MATRSPRSVTLQLGAWSAAMVREPSSQVMPVIRVTPSGISGSWAGVSGASSGGSGAVSGSSAVRWAV